MKIPASKNGTNLSSPENRQTLHIFDAPQTHGLVFGAGEEKCREIRAISQFIDGGGVATQERCPLWYQGQVDHANHPGGPGAAYRCPVLSIERILHPGQRVEILLLRFGWFRVLLHWLVRNHHQLHHFYVFRTFCKLISKIQSSKIISTEKSSQERKTVKKIQKTFKVNQSINRSTETTNIK